MTAFDDVEPDKYSFSSLEESIAQIAGQNVAVEAEESKISIYFEESISRNHQTEINDILDGKDVIQPQVTGATNSIHSEDEKDIDYFVEYQLVRR